MECRPRTGDVNVYSELQIIKSIWPNKPAWHYAQDRKELEIRVNNIGSSKNLIYKSTHISYRNIASHFYVTVSLVETKIEI